MKRQWIIAPLMTLFWVFLGFGLLESRTAGKSYAGDTSEDTDGFSKNGVALHEQLLQADVEDLSVAGTAISSTSFFSEFPFVPSVKKYHRISTASRPRFLLFHSFRFYG